MERATTANVDFRGVATGGRPAKPEVDQTQTLDAKARRRLRRLVDPSKRKRTAMACDACKRRKQKCNGLNPCNKCALKGCECVYAPQDGRFYSARAPKTDPGRGTGSSDLDQQARHSSHSGVATDTDSVISTTQPALGAPIVTSPPPPPALPGQPRTSGSESRMDWRNDAARHHQFQQSAVREQRAPLNSSRVTVNGSVPEAHLNTDQSPTYGVSQLPPPRALLHQNHQPAMAAPLTTPRYTDVQQRTYPGHSTLNIQSSPDGYRAGSGDSGVIYGVEGNASTTTYSAHTLHESSNSDITHLPGSTTSRGSQSDFPVETVGDGTQTRLLSSKRGKLNYIGESCTLSLLEQVRHLFRQTLGESRFTEDPERFHFVDGPEFSIATSAVQLPSKDLAEQLLQHYLDGVHSFFYVFEVDTMRHQISAAYRNPLAVKRSELCLLHLTFALGAIFYCDDHPDASFTPKIFFESGLGILLNDVIDDGDLWAVQGYLLVSLYFELVSKRNASWVYVGIAIRYGQSLGLGRKWVDGRFDKKTERHRHRLWRTLFILDRLRSAMLGRAMAIENADMVEYLKSEDDSPDEELLPSVRLCQLCKIIGDVTFFVYRSPNIYSSRAQALIDDMKQWGAEFQQLVNDYRGRLTDRNSQCNILLINLVYLNGLILLTRPFFFYYVSRERGNLRHTDAFEAEALEIFEQLSTACVESAKLSIRLYEHQRFENALPARSPLMIYYIFTAGVIILLKVFQAGGNLNTHANLAWIFASCLGTLAHYDKKDPSAKRYEQILGGMRDAISADSTSDINPSSAGKAPNNTNAGENGLHANVAGQNQLKPPVGENGADARYSLQRPMLYDGKDPNRSRSGVVTPNFFDIADLDLAINVNNNWTFSNLAEDAEAAQGEMSDILGSFPGFTMNSGF